MNRYPEVVPVSPVLNFCYFHEPEERENIMRYCFRLLTRCEELWLTGQWWNSTGCLQEKQVAEESGIPVWIYNLPPVIGASCMEQSIKSGHNNAPIRLALED